MQLILASSRGVLCGWLTALTIPPLIDPRAIAACSAAALHDPIRSEPAANELFGAALCAFEGSALAGLKLLPASFTAAAAIDLRHGEIPRWLALSAAMGILLPYVMHRFRHRNIK
jgi:hypothetical protein